MDEPVNVYVADDHEMIISGARDWLSDIQELDFTLVGHTTESPQVFDDVLRLEPDIVVLDVGFPQTPSGLTLASQISEAEEVSAQPVISTRFNNHPYFWESIASGAKAYIPKDEGQEVFKRAMVKVAKGGKFVPEQLIRSEHFDEKMSKLSARQLEWARHFSNGKTALEASDAMEVSRNAVYQTKRRVKEKLVVDDDDKLREMLGHYFGAPDWIANTVPA